jgi:N-acetylmuramoyl-L-alanine amidase
VAPTPDLAAVPASPNSRGSRSLIRAMGLKLSRVVIDPGHGGHDTGTISAAGLYEKDIVLDVAKRLGQMLESQLGLDVIYTRTDDTFVALTERTRIANEHRADLFLSIHLNSSRLRTVAGPETFYLNLTNSEYSLDVAARENASAEQSVHDLQDLVQKIALTEKIEESREFAERMQKAMHGDLARTVRAAKNRGVKKAPFVVLIGASMPSVLVEIGFLSNPREETLFRRAEHRQAIAKALFGGVKGYASTLSQTRIADRSEERATAVANPQARAGATVAAKP